MRAQFYVKKFAVLAILVLLAGPAIARKSAETVPEQPEAFRQLLECRSLTDAAQRLACYDAKAATLDAATQSREIVITDRAHMQEARRGLFGFAAPLGRMFGIGGDDDANEIKQIDTTVTEVRAIADGRWRITFAEGGTWEQTDTKNFPMSPKVGRKARISRGVLGSYFVSVDGMPGIKFRRVE